MATTAQSAFARLLALINRKDWWHVPPEDERSYSERGMFLASSYREAEFYGRPLEHALRAVVVNPPVGDERTIEAELLTHPSVYPGDDHPELLGWRWALDKELRAQAMAKGYDGIALLPTSSYARFTAEEKLPRSIELNLSHGPQQTIAKEVRS